MTSKSRLPFGCRLDFTCAGGGGPTETKFRNQNTCIVVFHRFTRHIRPTYVFTYDDGSHSSLNDKTTGLWFSAQQIIF